MRRGTRYAVRLTLYAVRSTLLVLLVVVGVWTSAEAGQIPEGPAQRAGARANRPLPGPARMDAQQLQQQIDALALVQAQKELNLTDEQQPAFVAKLVRLQNLRRRVTNGRRQLINELRVLLNAPSPREEAIAEKLKALNDLTRNGGDELIKATDELDAVLTPLQRGRFRLLEERLERQKVEMLGKLGANARGGGE